MFRKLLLLMSLALISNCGIAHAATAIGVALQYTTASLTTTTYRTVIDPLPSVVNRVVIYDTSNQPLILAVSNNGPVIDQIIIPPGGGDFPLNISKGARVSLRSSIGNVNVGTNYTNFFFD